MNTIRGAMTHQAKQIAECLTHLVHGHSPQDLRDMGYAQAAIDAAIEETGK